MSGGSAYACLANDDINISHLSGLTARDDYHQLLELIGPLTSLGNRNGSSWCHSDWRREVAGWR